MSGRILILDSVSTNRIVLKVKMKAAQYEVETCASCAEAEAFITKNAPDLLLINLSDPTEDRHSFCKRIKAMPATKGMVIVGLGITDTGRARFAALDAGVDDILPRPISDALLMARIRSLLRQRHLGPEWELRDETRRALGFEEDAAPRLTPAVVTVLTDQQSGGTTLAQRMQEMLGQAVRLMTPDGAMAFGEFDPCPDLFVIDGASCLHSPSRIYRLIAELQSRPETRHAALMVFVRKGDQNIAAMALDLGADDAVFDTITDKEFNLRTTKLLAGKAKQDGLRDRVRSGLNAAVTDPLTGLYNRRYAEAHVTRFAQQSSAAGCDYALMVLDIDHFKAINDTYGHAKGDEILTHFATRLRENLRAIDLIARIGGEEFLVLLPDTNEDLAISAAERLRSLICDTPFRLGGASGDLSVSISVGVTLVRAGVDDDCTPASLIGRADAALYKAKGAGRNQVFVSDVAA